ncbi:MAG: polysaccharide biosynthesis/export family protein [Chlamydiota bacterium]
MRAILVVLSFLTMVSCGCPKRYGYEKYKADEFVIDSYKIRQGKLSILEMEGESLEPFDPAYLEEFKDYIHNDDILKVAIYHPSRSDISAAVQSIGNAIGFKVVDDKITLPELEPITVAGLTLEEARLKIQNKYLEQIRDIEVFLDYKERLVKRVEIAGLVSATIPVNGRLRLYETLAQVGVPTSANLFQSYLIRDGQPLPVDFTRLLKEGDLSRNIVMRGEDKIYIADPKASQAMLMGEVGSPRSVSLPDGYMSLRELLVNAGGIPYTGNKKCIQVIRGNLTKPKIYTLSWEHIVHLPNDSLLVIPGDTVYIGAKPITEWDRFISQLLGTANSTRRVWSVRKF